MLTIDSSDDDLEQGIVAARIMLDALKACHDTLMMNPHTNAGRAHKMAEHAIRMGEAAGLMPVPVPPPVILPLNTALDTLKDWLQGRFDTGKRSGMRRTIPTTPPNSMVTTPCWTWMGAVSRGRSNTPPRPKGKPPACEATKHVQSIVLLRKYGWADMKGNIKVKLNCGNQLCCNPDHLAAGEQVVTVA